MFCPSVGIGPGHEHNMGKSWIGGKRTLVSSPPKVEWGIGTRPFFLSLPPNQSSTFAHIPLVLEYFSRCSKVQI
jgi:hypothetical protein